MVTSKSYILRFIYGMTQNIDSDLCNFPNLLIYRFQERSGF